MPAPNLTRLAYFSPSYRRNVKQASVNVGSPHYNIALQAALPAFARAVLPAGSGVKVAPPFNITNRRK
jgi:hypothetical protein